MPEVAPERARPVLRALLVSLLQRVAQVEEFLQEVFLFSVQVRA